MNANGQVMAPFPENSPSFPFIRRSPFLLRGAKILSLLSSVSWFLD
jgi:hypothetical protein